MSARAELPDYRTLQTLVDHGVGTITLDRPDRRNAVGDGMREELADAYLRFDRKPRWTGRLVDPTAT